MANNNNDEKKTLWIAAAVGFGVYLLTRPKTAAAQYPTYYPTSTQISPIATPTVSPVAAPTSITPGVTYKDEHFSVAIPWEKISGFLGGLFTKPATEQKEGVSKTITSEPTATQPLTAVPQPVLISPSMTK